MEGGHREYDFNVEELERADRTVLVVKDELRGVQERKMFNYIARTSSVASHEVRRGARRCYEAWKTAFRSGEDKNAGQLPSRECRSIDTS